jgi:4-amino-4-deoxy-L-arabinose transferase-like glycosyltransferase
MFWRLIKEQKFLLLTIGVIIVFFITKIPYLQLPFYWDEAWVYGPAVRKMAMTGISLAPDALPVDLTRGHPLLFHVLNASWIRVFGNTLFSVHIFNLLIACTLVFVIYLFGKKYYSEPVGTAAAYVLFLQPVFLSQSTLVLPEVMLGLFCLLALYFFLQDKYPGYLLFASAALLTKETGLAVVATCGLFFLITGYSKNKFRWPYWAGLIKTALPVLPLFIYLFLQKKMYGWFLFPEHIGYMTFDLGEFWSKFIGRYLTFTVLLQGRNLLFFAMIISILWLIYKKQKIGNMQVILALLLFIIIYSLIGAVNFFSKRYILCIIPTFIILSLGITFMTFRNKYLLPVFLVIFSLAQIQYIRFKNNSDHTLGFVNAVKANQSMIDYCLDNNMKDEKISVFFIQGRIMTDPLSGYIEENEVFTNLSDKPFETDYLIVSSYDTNDSFLNFRNKPEMKLIKRFEFGRAWIELYKNLALSESDLHTAN